jgi:hypothetical protein
MKRWMLPAAGALLCVARMTGGTGGADEATPAAGAAARPAPIACHKVCHMRCYRTPTGATHCQKECQSQCR